MKLFISFLLALVTATLQAQTLPIRVNVGGPQYTDTSGNIWAADTGCTSTSTYSRGNAIQGTTDPTLYRTGRGGGTSLNCTYTVNSPAYYIVTLKFAETDTSVTQTNQGPSAKPRIMNVYINDTLYFANLNVYASSAFATAYDIATPFIPVSIGQISITITQVAFQPMLSALEIDAVYNNNYTSPPPIVISQTAAGSAMSFLSAGSLPVYTTFCKANYTACSFFGSLGNPEANMSFNMSYATGKHLYGFDSTSNALWLTANGNGGPGNIGGLFLQRAPSGIASNIDIWEASGSQYAWYVDFNGNSVQLGGGVFNGLVDVHANLLGEGFQWFQGALAIGSNLTYPTSNSPVINIDFNNQNILYQSTVHGTGVDNQFVLRATRGMSNSPTTVVAADILSEYDTQGYDGSAYRSITSIQSVVDGAVSSGVIPGRLDFYVNNAGPLQVGMQLLHNRVLNVIGGYQIGGVAGVSGSSCSAWVGGLCIAN